MTRPEVPVPHPSARMLSTPYADAYRRLRAAGLTPRNALALAVAGYDLCTWWWVGFDGWWLT